MIRFLVVDDSATIRRVFKNILPKIIDDELEITEAEDGLIALSKVSKAQEPFHFIMLDVNMPNMNGVEFLTKLRSSPEHKDVRIIMATTEAEKSTIVSIMKKGANGYIVKPFQLPTVKRALQQHTARMGINLRD